MFSGNYLDQKSAARIGLIPEKLLKKTVSVGNATSPPASSILPASSISSFLVDKILVSIIFMFTCLCSNYVKNRNGQKQYPRRMPHTF